MAQSQQPEGGGAEFVRRIVTDPKNVPDVMRLYGYPGASSEEHHDRLYLNPDLSNYVEVPRHAILYRMEVPREQDPNGAVVLWVRRDAALIQKAAPAAQALAQYFAGAIAGAAAAGPVPSPWAAQYFPGAAGGAAIAGAAAMPFLPIGAAPYARAAPETVAACPTDYFCTIGCPSDFCTFGCSAVCETNWCSIPCGTAGCPTGGCGGFRNAPLSIACGGSVACGGGFGQAGFAPEAAAYCVAGSIPQTGPILCPTFHCPVHTPGCPR